MYIGWSDIDTNMKAGQSLMSEERDEWQIRTNGCIWTSSMYETSLVIVEPVSWPSPAFFYLFMPALFCIFHIQLRCRRTSLCAPENGTTKFLNRVELFAWWPAVVKTVPRCRWVHNTRRSDFVTECYQLSRKKESFSLLISAEKFVCVCRNANGRAVNSPARAHGRVGEHQSTGLPCSS